LLPRSPLVNRQAGLVGPFCNADRDRGVSGSLAETVIADAARLYWPNSGCRWMRSWLAFGSHQPAAGLAQVGRKARLKLTIGDRFESAMVHSQFKLTWPFDDRIKKRRHHASDPPSGSDLVSFSFAALLTMTSLRPLHQPRPTLKSLKVLPRRGSQPGPTSVQPRAGRPGPACRRPGLSARELELAPVLGHTGSGGEGPSEGRSPCFEPADRLPSSTAAGRFQAARAHPALRLCAA